MPIDLQNPLETEEPEDFLDFLKSYFPPGGEDFKGPLDLGLHIQKLRNLYENGLPYQPSVSYESLLEISKEMSETHGCEEPSIFPEGHP